MVEGYRFKAEQEGNRVSLAVAWGINFAFADKVASTKMLKALGVNTEPTEKQKAELEETRERNRKLLHKIETAQVASRRTLSSAEGHNLIR